MLRQSIAKAFSSAEPRNLRTHVGLWVDKMLAADEPSSQVSGPHLGKVVGVPVPEGYDVAFKARRALFEAEGCLLSEGKTASRMIVGLGAKGVLEVGLTLERTWGTPYIPGTALKGLCAAAANKLAAGEGWGRFEGWPEAPPAQDAELTDYQILFGTTANAGAVVFHDGCSSFMTVDDSAADHDFTRRRRGLGIGSGGAAPA